MFRKFGCRCWVHTPSPLRTKLAPRGKPGRFLGFVAPLGSKVYRVLLDSGVVTQSQTVAFDDYPAPPPLAISPISPLMPAADTPLVLPSWWPSQRAAPPSVCAPPSHSVSRADDDDDDDDDWSEQRPLAHAPAPDSVHALSRADSVASIESADTVPLRQMVLPALPPPVPPAPVAPDHAPHWQTNADRPRRACTQRAEGHANAAVITATLSMRRAAAAAAAAALTAAAAAAASSKQQAASSKQQAASSERQTASGQQLASVASAPRAANANSQPHTAHSN